MQAIQQTKMKRFDKFVEKIGFDKKDYQREGMKWVLDKELRLNRFGVRGGIIADEMGLGKTLLMIGALVANYKKGDRNLIIVPSSLLNQWKSIIEDKLNIKPLVYHGNKVKKTTIDDLNDSNKSFIVLSTYGMISTRKSQIIDGLICNSWTSLLWKVKWKRLICDEAQTNHMVPEILSLLSKRNLIF